MKNRFIIDDTERQSILEMHRRAILKETINEETTPKGWETFPCVPKHPGAKQYGEVYVINGESYYKNGEKIYKRDNTQ